MAVHNFLSKVWKSATISFDFILGISATKRLNKLNNTTWPSLGPVRITTMYIHMHAYVCLYIHSHTLANTECPNLALERRHRFSHHIQLRFKHLQIHTYFTTFH